jgi:hypothetical protein
VGGYGLRGPGRGAGGDYCATHRGPRPTELSPEAPNRFARFEAQHYIHSELFNRFHAWLVSPEQREADMATWTRIFGEKAVCRCVHQLERAAQVVSKNRLTAGNRFESSISPGQREGYPSRVLEFKNRQEKADSAGK